LDEARDLDLWGIVLGKLDTRVKLGACLAFHSEEFDVKIPASEDDSDFV
jgi:hypothetical protein